MAARTTPASPGTVLDLNDFDETLPGPFEWDVKRLVASMAVAGRENGLTTGQCRKAARAAAAAYRTAMRDFAAMPILDVWYARLDVEDALARLRVRDAQEGGAPDQGSDRQSPHPGQHAGAGETDDD